MSSKKNDAIEIDALINPTLGDMSKVEKNLSRILADAARPLVDTLNNAKVGLNEASLRKVQRDLDASSRSYKENLEAGMKAIEGQSAKTLRSAKGLKDLANSNGSVAKMVQVLGGYEKAATLLSRGDANQRLTGIVQAFQKVNDAAFQISKLPAVDTKTQNLLSQLYKSNTPASFKKLSEVQQRQVRDALAVIDLQDSAFRSLKNGMAKAGMGTDAANLNKALRERKANAARLNQITNPEAMARLERSDTRQREALTKRQANLARQESRARAVSEEKDRVLKRTGGISKLRDPADIKAVRSGLNHDYNLEVQRAALVRRTTKGGKNSAEYKAATARVDAAQALRNELNKVQQSLAAGARQINAQVKLNQQADVKEWQQRGANSKRWDLLNQKADLDAHRERSRQNKVQQSLQQKADLESWKIQGQVAKRQQSLQQRADLDEWKQRGQATKRWDLLNQKADLDEFKARTQVAKRQRNLNEKADAEEWKIRGQVAKRREMLNQKADLDEFQARTRAAKTGSAFAESQRLIQSAGGINKLSNPLDISTVRSGLNSQYTALRQQREVAQAHGQNTAAIQREIEAIRAQRNALVERTTALRDEAKALQAANKAGGTGMRTRAATNTLQARELLRASGGDFSNLGRDQIATLRPYMQDRFKQRSQHAETIGQRYGSNSPEFGRAAASAREYAKALEQLNQRANQLRPSIGDLGQVVRSFFRYALGYGALYQMLGAVTALGRGLVDLDESFYNIKAITLSTTQQMDTVEGAIKQVGMTTKFTLNEVAKAAQILAQAGTAPDKIPAQLRAVADFAAATGSSLEQSADLLTSFQSVYSGISDGKAADMMTKALNLSKLQGEDLRTIISYTAQTAEGYNISAEQLLAATATLRNAGIKPSTIATGLRQAMMEVFNPDAKLLKALKTRYKQMGEDMSESAISGLYNSFTFTDNPLVAAISELKRIGFGGEASNLFSRAFDIRAFNPLQALVNNSDEFNSMNGQIGVGRSAAEASEIQLESLRATLENLGAAVVSFSDSIGGGMVRSLQEASQEATELVQKLTDLDIAMKAEGGQGLAGTIGAGLAGGAIGALLGGKGIGNRLAGAAVGSYVGGSTQYSSDTEAPVSSYTIPAIAGLVMLAPAIMDFLGGIGGKGDSIRNLLGRTKGAGAAVGPALEAGSGLLSVFESFSKFSLKGAGASIKGMSLAGGARVAAGLFARALPVIGIIWTAYELLSMFSDQGTDATKAMADQARARAIAQSDQFRKLQAEYTEDRAAVDEYAIDNRGRAKSNTTAATAVGLKEQADNLATALRETFGSAATELGDADALLREYARRDTDQRKADRDKLEQITGKRLTDKEAFDLSSMIEQLDSNVDGYRDSLAQRAKTATDELTAAIQSGDTEAIDKAGAMQRVLDSMPDLREFLYGQVEIDATEVTELYIEFNKRMAAETEKGTASAAKVLEMKVKAGSSTIDAAAITLKGSPAIGNVIQQIIDNLLLTETNTVTALNALAENTRAKAEELGQEAAKLEKQAQENFEKAARFRNSGSNAGIGLADTYMRQGQQAEADAKTKRQSEAAQREAEELAKAEAARQKAADDLARTTARAASTETEKRVQDGIQSGLLTNPEFLKTVSANDRALLTKIGTGDRTDLVKAGYFKPEMVKTGKYAPSEGQLDMERLLTAATQYQNAQAELSKQKQLEEAKRAYLSDPKAGIEISRLQNTQKAAERRNDFGGAQAAAKQIADLQYAEQAKAVKRAEIDMNAKKDAEKSDATAATEKYYAEVAKLESLKGDMADKLDEYTKKAADLDLKRRTVEADLAKRSVQKEFNEAVTRGDIDGAKDASKRYEEVQAKLIKLAEEELAAKGYSPEQIELEVKARDELTTSLIDQEGAQKRLTDAILAQADFLMRDVGTGPTTGNRQADAYTEAYGTGFTLDQVGKAYERDLRDLQAGRMMITDAYARQREGLTGDQLRDLDREYISRLEAVDEKIGATAANLQQLRNNSTQELMDSINPDALLVQLEQSTQNMRFLGENIQGHLVSAFDNLGASMGRAIVEGEDLSDVLQNLLYETSSNIFTEMFSTGVNTLGTGALKMITGKDEGEADSSSSFMGMLGGMLGFGADKGEEGSGGLGGLLGDAVSTPSMTVSAGTVMLNGAVMGGAGGAGQGLLGAATGAVGDPAAAMGAETSWVGKLGDTVGGWMGGLTSTVTGAFDGFSGMLKGLFSSMGMFGRGGGDIGEGMKGGDWLKLGVQIVGSYYGGGMAGSMGGGGAGAASSAGGAMAGGDFGLGSAVSGGGLGSYGGYQGFKDGGQPSRVIQGARSAKRDNLVATATVGGKAMPIRVEADEGILSRKAMAAIGGEKGLNLLNSGKMPRFAVGGAPASGYNPGQPVTTGQDKLATAMQQTTTPAGTGGDKGEVNIANIYSDQGFADFVTSRSGRKVIINELKKAGVI